MIEIEQLVDDHLHTTVSDGELTPDELLDLMAARVDGPISITDHDTLGVHRWPGFADRARERSVELVPGAELDADFEGIEVHVLGYNFDPDDAALNAHLDRMSSLRAQRAREELEIVNRILGPGTFREADIFAPGRETLMKPHFIKPLIAKGLFPDYRSAKRWYAEHVKSRTVITKPPFETVADLLRGAGATVVLAHPGYYIEDDGMDLDRALETMKAQGLDGVEVDYPYHDRSRKLFTPEGADELVAHIRAATRARGLRESRGTDCHSRADFDVSYPEPRA